MKFDKLVQEILSEGAYDYKPTGTGSPLRKAGISSRTEHEERHAGLLSWNVVINGKVAKTVNSYKGAIAYKKAVLNRNPSAKVEIKEA